MSADDEFRAEDYRSYLRALARVQLAGAGPVRHRLDASDLVQDALLQAHAAREQFRGTSAEEYTGWLRRILATRLVDAQRRHGRQKRDAGLDEAYEDALDASSVRLQGIPVMAQTSPSQHVAAHQRLRRIASALETLPEDQRTAVEMRYLGGHAVDDIAAAMQRSRASAAGLIRRGLAALRDELAAEGSVSA